MIGARVAVFGVAALLLAACGFDGLAFRQDDRVEIVAPDDREAVTLPVTVEWRVDGFEVTGENGESRDDAGYFAVLVDRNPQPPGEPLAWLAREDDTCVASPDCPDEQYFAQRRVHTTTDTRFTVDNVLRPDRERIIRELHEVTVILLDGTGRRIGESAFSVEFEVDRQDT